MAKSITTVPPSTEPEIPKTNEGSLDSCGDVEDPALVFYGPPCRPADYKEPEAPTPILKTSKSERRHKSERCHKAEEAEPDVGTSGKEVKAEEEAKCQPECKFERSRCPRSTTNTPPSMVVRFADGSSPPQDKGLHTKVVIPFRTMAKGVYVVPQLVDCQISDCRQVRQVNAIGYQTKEKEKLGTDKSAESGKLEHEAGDQVPKKAKSVIGTVAACLSESKNASLKKGKSLMPTMENLMTAIGETEAKRLKNYRVREKNTLNSVQGITQWFLVSQAITMLILLILFIVFINVFGLLFAVVILCHR